MLCFLCSISVLKENIYKSQDPRSYGEAHFIISWGRKLTHEVQTSNSDGIQRAPSSNHDSCGHLVDDTDTDNMDRERGGWMLHKSKKLVGNIF